MSSKAAAASFDDMEIDDLGYYDTDRILPGSEVEAVDVPAVVLDIDGLVLVIHRDHAENPSGFGVLIPAINRRKEVCGHDVRPCSVGIERGSARKM